MKITKVQEVNSHLSRLLDDVAGGEEIILGKHGKPIARLSSFHASSEPRPMGGREADIQIAEDFDDEDPRIQAIFQ